MWENEKKNKELSFLINKRSFHTQNLPNPHLIDFDSNSWLLKSPDFFPECFEVDVAVYPLLIHPSGKVGLMSTFPHLLLQNQGLHCCYRDFDLSERGGKTNYTIWNSEIFMEFLILFFSTKFIPRLWALHAIDSYSWIDAFTFSPCTAQFNPG